MTTKLERIAKLVEEINNSKTGEFIKVPTELVGLVMNASDYCHFEVYVGGTSDYVNLALAHK